MGDPFFPLEKFPLEDHLPKSDLRLIVQDAFNDKPTFFENPIHVFNK